MANPFPGIDPYIEARKYWRDFHTRFLTYLCDAINDRLPDGYIAQLEEQFTVASIDGEDDATGSPDVSVLHRGPPRPAPRGDAAELAVGPVMLLLPSAEEVEFAERRIEVRRHPEASLVAAVEVLSPTNKAGDGRWKYLDKRRTLLAGRVHLVELDLLIGGERLPMGEDLPEADFYAIVSRVDRRPRAEVYAWTVRQALPTVYLPLGPGDPDVPMELGAIYETAHGRGRYDRMVRRGEPLGLPLADLSLSWVEARGREASGERLP